MFNKILERSESTLFGVNTIEVCLTSKMELFAKIVNGFQPLTIFARRSILDTSQGSE